jgi:hypothetical protein
MGTSPDTLCDEFATATISFRLRRAVKFPDPRRGVDYPLSTLVAATYTSFSQIEDGLLSLPYNLPIPMDSLILIILYVRC